MGDEALDAYLVPLLLRTREEWLVTSTTYTLVAGTSDYAVPSAALGGKTRLVQLVDVVTGRPYPPLPRKEPEEVPRLWFNGTGEPCVFLLEDNKVRLCPTPDAGAAARYQLRVSYHRQPSQLALLATVGEVATVGATTLTLAAAAPSTLVVGAAVDVQASAPPFELLTPATGLKVSAKVGAVVTLTNAAGGAPALTSAMVGGYLCPVGTSPIPQVPAVTHALLAMYVAEGLLKATDPGAASALADERQRAEAGALAAVTPRTEGNPRRVPNGFNKWRGSGW